MLRPSYSELMETLNNQKKVESQITSRYTIVLAAAKRARQIIDGANPLTYAPTDRAVSIAVKELDEGKLIIKANPNRLDSSQERPAAALYYQGITSVSKDDLREDFKDRYAVVDVREDNDDEDDNYKDDEEYKEIPYKDDDDDDAYKEDEDDFKDSEYKDTDYQDDEEEDSFKDDESYE